MNELTEVEDRVLRFMDLGGDFDDVLSAVVQYQLRHNPPLAAYFRRRGVRAGDLPPAVPTEVFRHLALHSLEAPVRTVFRTSGTTAGQRGASHRLSLRCYDHGAVAAFRSFFGDRPRGPWFKLVLDPTHAPDSSLSHMVSLFDQTFGLDDAQYWLDHAGLRPGAEAALRSLSEPTVLFGTAFAFVFLLDQLETPVQLPPGSILIETGGLKGRTRDVSRETLGEALCAKLGLTPDALYSEYSMTELSSQLYARHAGGATATYVSPPWCRVHAVDPDQLQPVPDGEVGLLRFTDLANVDTAVAIQTSDYGRVTGAGVELLGRQPGATPRGCSLAIEELVERLEAGGNR